MQKASPSSGKINKQRWCLKWRLFAEILWTKPMVVNCLLTWIFSMANDIYSGNRRSIHCMFHKIKLTAVEQRSKILEIKHFLFSKLNKSICIRPTVIVYFWGTKSDFTDIVGFNLKKTGNVLKGFPVFDCLEIIGKIKFFSFLLLSRIFISRNNLYCGKP